MRLLTRPQLPLRGRRRDRQPTSPAPDQPLDQPLDQTVVDLTLLDPESLSPGAPEADGVIPRMTGQRLRPGWAPASLTRRPNHDGTCRILILHVPKTGGSSLRLMLAAHVPEEQTFLSTGRHEWHNTSIADLSRYRLFTGHHFLEPLYLFPNDPWVTILPVREPLAWWRSYYKYQRRQAQAKGLDRPATRLPMDAWLNGLNDQALSNPQSSWLLTRARVMFDSPFQVEPRIAGTAACLDQYPDRAVRVLDRLVSHVTVVGVTDRLHELYLNACHALGEPPRFETAIVDNVTYQPEDLLALSDRQERRLRTLNQMDQYLYQRARRRTGQPG